MLSIVFLLFCYNIPFWSDFVAWLGTYLTLRCLVTTLTTVHTIRSLRPAYVNYVHSMAWGWVYHNIIVSNFWGTQFSRLPRKGPEIWFSWFLILWLEYLALSRSTQVKFSWVLNFVPWNWTPKITKFGTPPQITSYTVYYMHNRVNYY